MGNRTGTDLVVNPRELTGARRGAGAEPPGRQARRRHAAPTSRSGSTRARAGLSSPSSWPRTCAPPWRTTSPSASASSPACGCATATCAPTPRAGSPRTSSAAPGRSAPRRSTTTAAGATRAARPSARAASSRSTRASCAARPAATRREVNAAGEPTGREVVSSRAPRPGRDVQLTIDAPTQRALQDALAEQVSPQRPLHGRRGRRPRPEHGRGPRHGLLPGLRPLGVRQAAPRSGSRTSSRTRRTCS